MDWTLVTVTTTANGTVLSNPDGTVRSLNPTSLEPPYGPYYWSEMPAGTDGPYELCTVKGGFATYNPTSAQPVVFGFTESSPNSPCAGVSIQPL